MTWFTCLTCLHAFVSEGPMDLGTFVYSVSTYVPFSFTSVLNFVVHVPSCLRAFVGPKFFLLGISWFRNFFSWPFHGSRIFSRGPFVGPNFFLVGISWVQNFSRRYSVGLNFFRGYFMDPEFFFSSVFRGSKIFSRGYIVGLKYFPVGISVCSF